MTRSSKSPGKGNSAADVYADVDAGAGASAPGKRTRAEARYGGEPVQHKGGGGADAADVHAAAEAGTSGAGQALPHAGTIRASFGPDHDMTGVMAYVGGPAAAANESMGAEAYASGNKVAFRAEPDLHTAAHEAAHVVQQRSGVSVDGGVGQAGDSYERNADAVADRVVRGESAADLLPGGGAGGGTNVQRKAVQFTGHRLDEDLPEDAETPAHAGGREATAQRQYSYEQYVEMWEAERGRKMTKEEKETLNRGCIGITALNLTGGGNPPLDKAYATFEQAWAEVERFRQIFAEHPDMDDGQGGKLSDWAPVLFAKMFWSNQKPYDPNMVEADPEKSDQENRIENIKANRRAWDKSDPDAFPVDEDTGKVDMTGYKYDWARPKNADDVTVNDEGELEMDWHINFDYAFWDEHTQTFWHANHAQPGMKVYQSTRARFEQGYRDFDRTIYCVGFAKNYDPPTEAANH